MKENVVYYYGQDAEQKIKEQQKEWIIFPMERLKSRSPEEMAQLWKTFLIRMCRENAPELLRQSRIQVEELPARSPWFLYWMLPQLVQAMTKKSEKGIWIRDYDLPLLWGLQEGFGRYSTELISAVAESCLESAERVLGIYLTGQMPFPLYRISLANIKERTEVDEQRRKCARQILWNYFQEKGKDCWREWLVYFDGKKKSGDWRLNSEKIETPEHWKALLYFSQLEEELPALIGKLLGGGGSSLTELMDQQQSGRVWRMIYQMANRWDCRSIEEMEDLLQILFFCQNPECRSVMKGSGRRSRHNLIFVNKQTGQTKVQVKLSVKN